MDALRPSKPHSIFSDSRSNSDRRQVAEIAEDLLRRDGHLFHAALSCEFHEGVLTLRGRLPSYYLTQLAQTVVATVEGVAQVDNWIDVVTPSVPMYRLPK